MAQGLNKYIYYELNIIQKSRSKLLGDLFYWYSNQSYSSGSWKNATTLQNVAIKITRIQQVLLL